MTRQDSIINFAPFDGKTGRPLVFLTDLMNTNFDYEKLKDLTPEEKLKILSEFAEFTKETTAKIVQSLQ